MAKSHWTVLSLFLLVFVLFSTPCVFSAPETVTYATAKLGKQLDEVQDKLDKILAKEEAILEKLESMKGKADKTGTSSNTEKTDYSSTSH